MMKAPNARPRRVSRNAGLHLVACACAIGFVSSAHAQTASPAAPAADQPGAAAPADKPWAPPANFGEWASSIKLSFEADGGITVNTNSPNNRRNFGELTNDNSNRPILNQLSAIAERDVDPKSTGIDAGFKLWLMYGSDARITHTLGVFDQLIHDRNQLDVVEADVSVRFPNLFANGMDLKAGIFPSPMGIEVIDPKGNPFYSHSYTFQYGLPFKNTGVLTTAHVSDVLDLYLGIDSGTNTFVAYGAGDNNNRPGGYAGFGLNLAGGNLTVLALTHIGPDNSKHLVPFANSALRFFNDVDIVWKANEKLTISGEFNYVREDGYRAEGYGAAGYASYALNDQLTLNGRAEIWRDNNNFFVYTPSNNLDFVASERGTPANLITASKPTTYSEFTLGVTYKIPGLPSSISTAMIRPEVRYDRALNDFVRSAMAATAAPSPWPPTSCWASRNRPSPASGRGSPGRACEHPTSPR